MNEKGEQWPEEEEEEEEEKEEEENETSERGQREKYMLTSRWMGKGKLKKCT